MAEKNKIALYCNLLEYFWVKGWLTDEELENLEKKSKDSFAI